MIFLDTNILVYLFDADTPHKQQRVRELLSDKVLQERFILSTQVLQEFYVTVTRKLATPVDPDVAEQAVRDFTAWPLVQIDLSLLLLAITRSRRTPLSFWDALIIQAALAGGAAELYSEDLQNGMVIEGMRLINPLV